MLTLHVLGSGGYIPNTIRETSALLLEDGKDALLLDLGSGVSRLLDEPFVSLLAGFETVSVVVTHYHLDHLIGLTWLPKVYSGALTIYGPQAPDVEAPSARTALEGLTAAPYFSKPLSAYPTPPDVVPVGSDSEIEMLGETVTFLPQVHSGGSIGVRVGERFAYVTDTDPAGSDGHVSFATGVGLLVVDTMYDNDHYERLKAASDSPLDHGGPRGNAGLAKAIGADEMWMVHVSPDYGADRVRAMEEDARAIFSGSRVPADGLSFKFG
jgi:ribonuclease BN (tRNA processing enzyme)